MGSTTRFFSLSLLSIVCFVVFCASPLCADSLTSLETRLESLETRSKEHQIFSQLRALLEEARAYDRERSSLERRIRQAPKQLEEYSEKLDGLQKVTPEYASELLEYSVAELEELEEQQELEAKVKEVRLSQLQRDLDSYLQDEERFAKRLETLRKNISRPAWLQDIAQDELTPELLSLSYDIHDLFIERKLTYLEYRLKSRNVLADLIRSERKLFKRELALLQERLDYIRSQQTELRRKRAVEETKRLKEVREQLMSLGERFSKFLVRNEELAELRLGEDGLIQDIANLEERVTSVQDSIDSVQDIRLELSSRVEELGLNVGVARLLRTRYEDLPVPFTLRQEIALTKAEFDQTQRLLLKIEEEAKNFDGDAFEKMSFEEALAEQEVEDAEARERLEESFRNLVRQRGELFQSLQLDLREKSDVLVELANLLEELNELSLQLRGFIEEQIFWIRSIEDPFQVELVHFLEFSRWLLAERSWGENFSLLLEVLRSKPFRNFFAFVLILIIAVIGAAWERSLIRFSDRIERHSSRQVGLAAASVIVSAVIALPFPALLYLIGAALHEASLPTVMSAALGKTLLQSAVFIYPLFFFRALLRKDGAGEEFLRWRSDAVSHVRSHLRWFIPSALVASMAVTLAQESGNLAWYETVGRFGFLFLSLFCLWFVHRVFGPSGPLMKQYLERIRSEYFRRLNAAWHWSGVLLFGMCFLLALFGYFYSARAFLNTLYAAGVLFAVLLTLLAISYRWLFLARRRALVETAKAKRELAKKKGEDDEEGEMPKKVEEMAVDLSSIDQQTRNLFRGTAILFGILGLYLICAQVAPALGYLDRIQLWPELRITEVTGLRTLEEPPERKPAPLTEPKETTPPVMTPPLAGADAGGGDELVSDLLPDSNVTLHDLLLAILTLTFVVVGVRNIPALLEIILLQRIPLEPGTRYAVNAVFRYLILLVGGSIALSVLGISWSKVQWLAAAITFGLAFGLQEIFANFISGLIILFEQPIRIGDTVTIGETTGTVSKIRMRATTVVDWDRKELLIPNKEFVTGQVINWSLSDNVVRIVIPVGVAYGSDTALTKRLLLQVARSTENVLENPPPNALFLGFGESSLDFQLRCYIPKIEYLFVTKSELHFRVDDIFREHGVEIAFPQRDLHLRSISPGAEPYPAGGGQ